MSALMDRGVKDKQVVTLTPKKSRKYREQQSQALDNNEDGMQEEVFLPSTTATFKVRRRGRRRKNQQKIYYNYQQHKQAELSQQQITQHKDKLLAKRTRMEEYMGKNNQHSQWYGDRMSIDEKWPKKSRKDFIRLFGINMNGVAYHQSYIEWELIQYFLFTLQVDVYGITEVNLDLNNKQVVEQLRQRVRKNDPHAMMVTSSSLQQLDSTPFKMGGTVLGTTGGWSGRINRRGSDTLGRWTYITFDALHSKEVVIINFYRVCAQHHSVGGGTIYMQQKKDLLKARGKDMDPRKVILQDMAKFIKNEHEKGNLVILMGDANEELRDNDNSINDFLHETGMKNIMAERFGDDVTLPTTYDRGNKCIDLMAMSAAAPQGVVQSAGYLPFYHLFATDHRGYYVDLNIEKLFDYMRADTIRQFYRRFTTTRITACDNYLQALESMLEKAGMFKNVDRLEEKMREHREKNGDDPLPKELVQRCITLCTKTSQLMMSAEKKSGPAPYQGGHRFSPRLRDAAIRVTQAKKKVRMVSLGMMKEVTNQTKDILQRELEWAKKDLKDVQRCSAKFREDHLNDLAEKRANQWNLKHSEALLIIKVAEKSRDRHEKHRRWLKDQWQGTLRHLLVPKPITGKENAEKDKSQHAAITSAKDIANVLLRRNFQSLLLSNHSIFRRGQMLDLTGWDAEGEAIEDILQGTANAEKIASSYPEFMRECIAFIRALQQPRQAKEQFQWTFGVEEYCNTFKKTRESTACGPSGLHMSHWKAATERPRIARVHAFFIWAAFQFGFTYPRWEISWHCMLQKLNDPIVSKLRIVQLFEGDFNGGLKYLMGRLLMQYMTDNAILDKETFGSRLGKTAPEAMINLQLLFDHHRLWLLCLIIIFNDAAGCYDRVPPNLSDITLRRAGAPKQLARAHTITQRKMKHYVRIAAGISLGFLQFSVVATTVMKNDDIMELKGLIGGIGQGGGGGPLIWLTVSIVMIEAFRTLCNGADMTDPLGWFTYLMWVVSYVDDNTLVRSFPPTATHTEIFQGIQENIQTWRKLLQITGGDLSIEKSCYSIMAWKRHPFFGNVRLETAQTMPGRITVGSAVHPNLEADLLPRQEPSAAQRVLGLRLPMTGDMTTEYNYRVKQIRKFAKKVYNAPLSHYDAWVIYESRYRAMIKYPLPVTTFSEQQCHEIQRHFIYYILPKMGLNRHTARALIYGPRTLGGMELMDLRLEQPTVLWETTLGHLRRMDRVGQGLRVTLHDHQIIIGSSSPFYNLDPERYGYVDQNTRWTYMWRFLHTHSLHLEVFDMWTPQPSCSNDVNIMDFATKIWSSSKYHNDILRAINACRLYLQVFFVSDLTSNGTAIDEEILTGVTRRPHAEVTFPPMLCPTQYQWEQWRKFLSTYFHGKYSRLRASPVLPSDHYLAPFFIRREKEWEEVCALRGWKTSMLQLLTAYPDSMRSIMGEIQLPRDNGKYLLSLLRDGKCLGASDGSFKETFSTREGGYGYTLSSTDGDNQNDLKGWAAAPTTSNMSSTTTEQYGYIAIILSLHLLTAAQGVTEGTIQQTMYVYIDNEEVVRRANTPPPVLNVTEFTAHDSDLWHLAKELCSKLPFRVQCQWIKGHQDELPSGEKIHGPFQRPIQLNIAMDGCASEGRMLGASRLIPRPLFSTTVMQITNEAGLAVDDIRQYLLHQLRGQDILEYYRKRRGWKKKQCEHIDWEAIHRRLQKAQPTRRIRILQLMHGWQHVGRQKAQFAENGAGTNAIRNNNMEDPETPIGQCPCCDQVESQLHYLWCTNKDMMNHRATHLGKLRRRLLRLHTYPGIIHLTMEILKSLDEDQGPDIVLTDFEGPQGTLLCGALLEQEMIGWKAFAQGFISRKWKLSQSHHVIESNIQLQPKRQKHWNRYFITGIQEYAKAVWTHRNEFIHGASPKEGRMKRKEHLRKRVQELYLRHEQLHLDLKYFRLPLEKRLQQGVHNLDLWVGLAKSALNAAHTEGAPVQRRIHEWLQCRSGEPHYP